MGAFETDRCSPSYRSLTDDDAPLLTQGRYNPELCSCEPYYEKIGFSLTFSNRIMMWFLLRTYGN
nr:hypothetical protein Q903MT_gene5395 [Picea sitchensis]